MAISLYTVINACKLSSWHRTVLLYGVIWTAFLSLTVAIAALTPEASFMWAITPSSSFSRACVGGDQSGTFLRVPVDLPSDIVCLPAKLFRRSKIDFVVPPIFAALVVASSACVVRFMGL